MLLVADQGQLGLLDPADLVLCAQGPDGELASAVRLVPLGALLAGGEQDYKRLSPRSSTTCQVVRHLPDDDAPPRTLYGLLVSLPRSRQWMVVAALGIGSLLMLRAIRRYRKQR